MMNAPSAIRTARPKARQGLFAWLAGIQRQRTAALFAADDDRAGQHGWQVTQTRGGRGRRYRDPRFDALGDSRR